MNCFEIRQAFVPFWQRTMPSDQRAAFNTHLQSCERCDRSFRVFALTAPVLHSDGAPMVGTTGAPTVGAARTRVTVLRRPSVRARRDRNSHGFAMRSWWALGAAGAVAAAVLAVYVMAARPSSAYVLEQTITGDDPSVELTSFTTGEMLGPDSTAQDSNHPILQETPVSAQDDFAG